MARRIAPRAISTAGLKVFSVVFVAPELESENTITKPSVMLVRYAPST